MRSCNHPKRGLTLVELMLSLVITAMVGVAIAAMLGAMSSAIVSKRDSRTMLVGGSAAQARLATYIMPSRCVLAAGAGNLVLWFSDARQGDTVHASEIRWLLFDPDQGAINVFFVAFPEGWTQTQRELEDDEYPPTTNWMTVLDEYSANGWIAGFTLIDGLSSVVISLDHAQPTSARQVTYRLSFEGERGGGSDVIVTGVIRDHHQPQ